ncbi:MAG: hypothetical protein ACRBCL_12020 [Maritimibacter sp.]
MSRATPIRAGDSTTGTAAFIGSPIPFILKLIEEKTVVFDVEGYSARGAAKFILDDPKTIEGIYALAETCQWRERLPKIEKAQAPTAPNASTQTTSAAQTSTSPTKPLPTPKSSGRAPMSDLELRLYLRELKPEVRKLGLARVTEILNEVMINEK